MVSSEYFLKSLTELLEIRKSLSWAPENFPPAICERQVFNLGRVAHGSWGESRRLSLAACCRFQNVLFLEQVVGDFPLV